ncbi:DUF4846 domain-containing protein [Moheibacter sp.]|uniref:DUF4846 domain-containing protein n=1 Tax=Moheibacter sp. TaxID=1965316 RepID=UPI003C759FE4
MKKGIFIFTLLSIISCNTLNQESVLYSNSMGLVEGSPLINDYGKTVLERFDAPLGYSRVAVSSNTFGDYLRTLSLKPEGTLVQFYNGKTKPNNNVYVSVVDMPISDKNLQTSTDSVMRLISEYLFQMKDYEKIVFHADKQKLSFTDFANGDHSRAKFNQYMDFVMERVSTPSFCADLKPVKLDEIKVGDIFVQNTQPNGHAVIVVDLVQNIRGEKLFLLAQGFQPAQEIQILANPNREDISPWYHLKEGELLTPEWRFMTSDLMRFKFLQD